MEGFCDICGNDIEVTMCCSGHDCGCMGMPTEPPVCSKECFDKYVEKYSKLKDDARTNKGTKATGN